LSLPLARWQSADPTKHLQSPYNLYWYVGNRALVELDPSGRFAQAIPIVAVVIVIVLIVVILGALSGPMAAALEDTVSGTQKAIKSALSRYKTQEQCHCWCHIPGEPTKWQPWGIMSEEACVFLGCKCFAPGETNGQPYTD
jgi:hypothetical protein